MTTLHYLLPIFALTALSAEIIETEDIEHLLTHVDDKSLVVFDLDNTLIEPTATLGSDQWVCYMIGKEMDKGSSLDDALNFVIPLWQNILATSAMQLVDPLAVSVVSTPTHAIGLTKRDPKAHPWTVEQLTNLNLNFTPQARLQDGHLFEHLDHTLYADGVIFVAKDADKGSSLLAYLEHCHEMPSKIIAIDDKLSHVKSLEQAADSLGIPFVGVRYGKVDEKVKNFDSKHADEQLDEFLRLGR